MSAIAFQMQTVAIGWLVYDLTSSPLALGLVGLAAFLPSVGFVLIAGHAADRFDRRDVLVVCYVAMTLVALGYVACVWLDVNSVGWIYLLILLAGTGRAFGGPAAQALVPNLVSRSELGNAIAWNASIFQVATILGPAFAGVLLAFDGIVVFAVTAVLYLLAFIFFWMVSRRPVTGPKDRASLTVLLAGARFIRSQPVILGAVSLDLFAVLLGGAVALMPIFARDILHVGPEGLGLLYSAPAAGAVAMAILLAHFPLERNVGLKMFLAVGVFGVSTIVFGLSTDIYLSLSALFVLGAVDMISIYVRQTLVQGETPDAMRGRVGAINSVFIGASNQLGEFESGVVAAMIGTVGSVVVGGVGTIIVAVLWMRWFPELARRDKLIE